MAPVPPQYQAQPQTKKPNTALIVIIILVSGFCLIVLIFAAILFPVFSQARLAASKSATLSEAKSISLALAMYAAEHDETMPASFMSTQDLRAAAEPYNNPGALTFLSKNPDGGEFLPNGLAEGLQMWRVVSPSEAILIYESVPWKSDNSRVVGRFDVSAKFIKEFDETTMLQFEVAPEE